VAQYGAAAAALPVAGLPPQAPSAWRSLEIVAGAPGCGSAAVRLEHIRWDTYIDCVRGAWIKRNSALFFSLINA